MKRSTLVIAIFSVMSLIGICQGAHVGITLGQPHRVALSLKSAHSRQSYDFAASWANSGLYLHADYLMSTYMISKKMPLYMGIGVRTTLNEGNSDVGMRIPFGLSIYLSKLELFAEIVPSLMLVPDMDFITQPSQSYGIGMRYYLDFLK